MHLKMTAFVAMLLAGFSATGADLVKYFWNDFEGNIGNARVRMGLYLEDSGKITGSYCYNRVDTRISLTGKVQGNTVELTEWIDGKPHARFSGKLKTDSADRFEGSWTSLANNQSTPFRLTYQSNSHGAPDERYGEFLMGSDQEVEQFMKKIKTAIVKGDRNWLADQFQYPMTTLLNGKTAARIKTKKEFLEKYNQIIHPAFKSRMAGLCTCHLFFNYRGAMLGNGEIWINNRKGSTENAYGYVISALNNF